MARGSAGESVLHKHLRVLDAFDSLHPFLTLSEIADVAGLARSTAHRLVGELEHEGLLERLPDRTYRLGVRLWEYASRTPGALGLREVARPWLGAVHGRVRQHIQLGIRQGTDVLFIERISYPGAVINATLIGGRIPLQISSSGLVLLAHADAALLEQIAAAPMRPYTEHTIRTGAQLRRAVARARADGFAVTPGHIHVESRGIAVPVRGPAGDVVAAIGLVVPNDDAPAQQYVELLTLAAAGITRDLVHAYGREGEVAAETLGVSERALRYIAEIGLEREAKAHAERLRRR